MNSQQKITPSSTSQRRWSWLWLALGALGTGLCSGKYTLIVGPWLLGIFLLRFVIIQRPWIRWGAFVGTVSVAFFISQLNFNPLPIKIFSVSSLINGLLMYLPFFLHVKLSHRLPTLFSTLVFPSATVALELLFSAGPFGSWGSFAYTQYANLPFVQLASITGIWGITFLITWSTSVINLLWEHDWKTPTLRPTLMALGLSLASVHVYGIVQLTITPKNGEEIRISGVARSKSEDKPQRKALRSWRALDEKSEAEREEIWQEQNNSYNTLFERSHAEALAGSKIIVWNEWAALVSKEYEQRLIKRGAEFAKKHSIYLGMGIANILPQNKLLLENKLVLISPSGEIASEYLKTKIVPGEPCVAGTEGLQYSDTEFGRISSSVCFDNDFQDLIRNAGANQTNLHLAPSNDWLEIQSEHNIMAAFRAIENGFTVLRPTSNGISSIIDPNGRVKNQASAFDHEWPTTSAIVSLARKSTLYSKYGDWFSYVSVAMIIALTAIALLKKKHRWNSVNDI
ncbi:hypothetical protein MLD52_02280 [Puniceicoccaceae bacterium K14]|nr:hypothetical protein [Puniceicoccaceae bacterium K14]